MTFSSPKTIGICVFFFLASALVTLTFQSSPSHHHPQRRPASRPHDSSAPVPRLAYATFLSGNANPSRETTDAASAAIDDADDGYYIGTRVLAYQLLHSPVTSTNASIPFLVLVTPDVSPRKRARLAADGATIVPVSKLESAWVQPANARWVDVLAKLRLFELTSYTKICFMDSDTLLTKRIDDIFWDEATLTQSTLTNPAAVVPGEAPLPRTYMFAARADTWGYEHAWPPDPTATYLNCGFFVFAPSKALFEYYTSLLAVEGKFDPAFPEQNLLNYAHRRDGNMPWTMLWYGWNVNWPTDRDRRGGAASFHAKYWDGDPSHDVVLKAIWREQRAEMEGFWRGVEGRRGRRTGMLGPS